MLARVAEEPSGLQARITSITPSSLRPSTPLEVSGTVTNTSPDTWRNAQVFLVLSSTPMTTRAELAEAVRADPSAVVGERIIEPELFAQLGDLRSGDLSTFALRIPYAALPISDAGVYWLSVQVLATAPSGVRDEFADARARTFIAQLPERPAPATVSVSLLWPITAAVPELRAGVFVNDQLGRAFSAGGRLAEMLALAETAPRKRLNWLIDPAVLAAAERMSDGYVIQGNRRKRVGVSGVAAASWLASMRALVTPVGGRRAPTTLSLPYGDPDATALVHGRLHQVLRPAFAASGLVTSADQLDSVPTLWPADGLSDRRSLAAGARAGTSVSLLSDRSLPLAERGAPLLTVPTKAGAVQTLVADSTLFSGGPRPGPTGGALQVRQRLLAETALLSLSQRGRETVRVVVAPPRSWDPDEDWAQADFFDGLQVPWLQLSPLTDVLGTTPDPYPGRFEYSAAARRAELPKRLLSATRSLRRVSTTLAALLTTPGVALRRYERSIGTSASVHWRKTPGLGGEISSAQGDAVRESLDSVEVQTSSFVTLSSSSGRFPVTITNGLQGGINVGLSVSSADPALGIAAVRPVLVQSQQRTTITVTARAERIGLTSVTVRPVTASGRPFGQGKVISVRATQYGLVGWLIVGVGLAVLFATSALRIWRRLRARRVAASVSP